MASPDEGDIPRAWRWPRGALQADAVACLASALAAVAPGAAVDQALGPAGSASSFTHLLALGKAALPMAEAATRWQVAGGRSWRASLVVAPVGSSTGLANLHVLHGDHPVPDARSAAAAAAIEKFAEQVDADARVLLLLSGGTTSLVGAPIPHVSLHSLQTVFRLLLASGLDIHASNKVRQRLLRWGGGRLAVALAPATTHALAISDVPGDDPATIGSGPVSPATSSAADVTALLHANRLVLPADATAALEGGGPGCAASLPAPNDPCFSRVSFEVIASNAVALEAAARTARSLGYATVAEPERLRGEAHKAGTRIAQRLRSLPAGRHALILGGETTVTLGPSSGTGGRNQELALAAAQVLQGDAHVALLAAGTDGKDGNSGNAGGLVDGTTWQKVEAGAARLRQHDSAPALASAGAEVYTGPTGTNVMDVVIALSAKR